MRPEDLPSLAQTCPFSPTFPTWESPDKYLAFQFNPEQIYLQRNFLQIGDGDLIDLSIGNSWIEFVGSSDENGNEILALMVNAHSPLREMVAQARAENPDVTLTLWDVPHVATFTNTMSKTQTIHRLTFGADYIWLAE